MLKNLYIFLVYNFPHFSYNLETTALIFFVLGKVEIPFLNSWLVLGEPLGFFIFHIFISSYFHFFLFWFLQNVFIADCICLFHCFFHCLLLLRVLLIWKSTFYSPLFFTLYSFPAFIKASLGPSVLLWGLQAFPPRLETHGQPICLFESPCIRWLYDKYGTLLNLLKYADKSLVVKSLINFKHINWLKN